jgi:hypothetical protein
MHRRARFRSDIAVDLQALVSLELKDVVGTVPQQHKRDPRQSIEAAFAASDGEAFVRFAARTYSH